MIPNKDLEQHLSQLPGVGPRQAKRIVSSLLRREPRFSQRLGELIQSVRSNMKLCQQTYQYFYSDDDSVVLSPIANDSNRQQDRVLVVETDSDLENIEKTDLWPGTYFVLGGVLKPALDESQYQRFIRINEFQAVMREKFQNNKLNEVVIGLGSTVNGDFTANIIKNIINDINQDIKVTQLGRGLSTGTSIEYLDKTTLQNALDHRL